VENPRANSEERARALSKFIDELVQELEPLQREFNELTWLANITGSPEHEQASATLDARIRVLFSKREPYEFLRGIEKVGDIHDPALARQLKLLLNTYRAHQIPPATIERMVAIEKSLESRFNNFRALLGGERVSDNHIRQVLHRSQDVAERRAAWEASKQIGAEVVADLIELVKIRNAAARDLGFANFYTMSLTLDELDEDELFQLLDDLDRGTGPLFDRYRRELDERISKRFGISPREVRPWHMSDPFFQEAPQAEVDLDPFFSERPLEELSATYFRSIGLEIEDLLKRADLYEKPGKSQHAFCLQVDRKGDIRVLCNLRPNEQWMSTLLHELGHAVYDQHVDMELPYLLRTASHTLTTEASAMLFGRLSKNAAWLHRYAGLDRTRATQAGEKFERAIREQLLVQTRWCLVMCHMERALYRDPDQDLDTLWWNLVERFQKVPRPDGRHAPDWASKIHFSVAPVYYQNYMLGEIMASQLQHHILARVLGGGADAWERYVSSPKVGQFLIVTLFRSGKALDWRGTIRQATGAPLQTDAFVSELAGSR
jgi:peptidyl-dipeptidase A